LSTEVHIDIKRFAAEFNQRIRKSPLIPEAFKPSTRQPIAVAKLLSTRYMKNGRLSDHDFVEAAVVTSHANIRANVERLAIDTLADLIQPKANQLRDLAVKLAEPFGFKASDEEVLNLWFKHRDEFTEVQKKALLERARQALAKVGLFYAKQFINHFYIEGDGPEKGYSTRQFRLGIDDPGAIDFELTLEKALVEGKKLQYLSYEDFRTRQVRRQRRSVIYLQDASASFDYRILLNCAVCGSMLVHGLPRDDKTAIALFSDDVEAIKQISTKEDNSSLIDKLLSIEPLGGTNISNAIRWARGQFEEVGRNYVKFCLIFSDMGFQKEDVEQCLKDIAKLQNLEVKISFLKFEPFLHYYQEGTRMLDEAGCDMVNVEKIMDFPELVSRIISPS
jgi:Mg-chelatase subunit ChlD